MTTMVASTSSLTSSTTTTIQNVIEHSTAVKKTAITFGKFLSSLPVGHTSICFGAVAVAAGSGALIGAGVGSAVPAIGTGVGAGIGAAALGVPAIISAIVYTCTKKTEWETTVTDSIRGELNQAILTEVGDDRFNCPISKAPMIDPVLADDGYTYERDNIVRWLHGNHNISPMTKQKVDPTKLRRDYAVRAAMCRAVDEVARKNTETNHLSKEAAAGVKAIQQDAAAITKESITGELKNIISQMDEQEKNKEDINYSKVEAQALRIFSMVLRGDDIIINNNNYRA